MTRHLCQELLPQVKACEHRTETEQTQQRELRSGSREIPARFVIRGLAASGGVLISCLSAGRRVGIISGRTRRAVALTGRVRGRSGARRRRRLSISWRAGTGRRRTGSCSTIRVVAGVAGLSTGAGSWRGSLLAYRSIGVGVIRICTGLTR